MINGKNFIKLHEFLYLDYLKIVDYIYKVGSWLIDKTSLSHMNYYLDYLEIISHP